MTGIAYARRVWQLLETLHAVTYFADEAREANRAVGLRGFWMGYFASRAAPLGPAEPALVTATFANFHPAMVARALPDAWTYARPDEVVRVRARAAATALRRLASDIDDVAARALPLLARVVETAPPVGRPLFAANRALDPPADPVAALWQASTSLREHRGDGHVATLVGAGLDGCGIHVLFAAGARVPPALLRDNRGWSDDDWATATAALEGRGLVDGDRLTTAGAALRDRIEVRTDELAGVPYDALADDEREELLTVLTPPARAVATSGVVPFPNPMGLPRLGS